MLLGKAICKEGAVSGMPRPCGRGAAADRPGPSVIGGKRCLPMCENRLRGAIPEVLRGWASGVPAQPRSGRGRALGCARDMPFYLHKHSTKKRAPKGALLFRGWSPFSGVQHLGDTVASVAQVVVRVGEVGLSVLAAVASNYRLATMAGVLWGNPYNFNRLEGAADDR